MPIPSTAGRVSALGCVLASLAAAPARSQPPRWAPPVGSGQELLRFDPDQSAGVGAENLLFLGAALGRLEDRLLPTRLFEEERLPGRLASFGYRFAKVALLDLPVAAFLPVLQHEVYGHGWRAREEGHASIEYEFAWPPPYGVGNASTAWEPEPAEPVYDRDLAMDLAGIEATDILAGRQRLGFMRDGFMDYHGALLYLGASLGLVNYVFVTREDEEDLSNDVAAWLHDANLKADATGSRAWVALSDLEDGSRWALADPFLWYSAWALLRYLGSGRTHWIQPAVGIGPVRWVPLLGYRLTPFGGQGIFESLLAWRGRTAALRAAWGSGEPGTAVGIDLEAREVAAWKGFALDLALHGWSQPRLRLSPGRNASRDGEPGGALSADLLLPALGRAFPLRLALGITAKSRGYLPGAPLAGGHTLRAGIGLFP